LQLKAAELPGSADPAAPQKISPFKSRPRSREKPFDGNACLSGAQIARSQVRS
jgi:hypothetical protein